MRAKHLAVVAAACLSLTACGGGSTGNGVTLPASSPTPSPTPTPGSSPCPDSLPAPPDLLYPMPNATGVPDGNFTLVAGYANSAPPVPQLVPVNGGTAVTAGAWGPAPSPLPSPAATPRSSGETLYGSAIPPLAARTAYNVQVTFGSPPCQSTENAGTFTTQ